MRATTVLSLCIAISAGLLGDLSALAADLSTETILTEIAQGSSGHLARIKTGRGQAEMSLTRFYPPVSRPKLPGGVIRLDDEHRRGVLPRRTPRVDTTGVPAPAATGAAHGSESTKVEQHTSIAFVFQGRRRRWDVTGGVTRSRGEARAAAVVRRALVGETLVEYNPKTDRASTRTMRGSQPGGRSGAVEPFDPLHYGVKYFGRPLAELVHETAVRTSATIDAVAGRDLYLLTIAPEGKENRSRKLWIDSKRGYTIQRYEAVDPTGFVSISLSVDYAHHKNDVWVPRRVEHDTYDPKTRVPLSKRRITFAAFVPNTQVRDAEFTLAGMGAGEKTRGYGRGSYGNPQERNTRRRD